MSAITQEELEKLLDRPTVSVPVAGKILADWSEDASYRAAQAGHLYNIKIGRTRRVPTAWLRQQLGLVGQTKTETTSAIRIRV